MNFMQRRVVLRVNAGESPLREREFVCGTPVDPFSVGRNADWTIVGPGVEETHLFLAFDGHRLHVAAAAEAYAVSVQCVAIGTGWTHLAVPSRLVFGAASIAIECDDGTFAPAPIRPCPIVDLSAPNQQPTQVVDLSQTLKLRTVRLEIPEGMLAELREATPVPPAPPLVPQPAAVVAAPATNQTVRSGDTMIFQPAPVATLAFPLPAHLANRTGAVELANTLYDGGALRERAIQLAGVQESEAADAVAAPESAPLPIARRIALRRYVAMFRRSSLPKQLTLLLLPLAIAGVWAMRDGSTAASQSMSTRSGEHHDAVVVAPSAAPTALAAGAPTQPVAPPLPTAPEIPRPANDPTERLALVAAASGNKAEAAALYERLARNGNARTFALAARLVRQDRVRKP